MAASLVRILRDASHKFFKPSGQFFGGAIHHRFIGPSTVKCQRYMDSYFDPNSRNFHSSQPMYTTPELKEWREHRVIDRFYRLPWGAWIRTRGGRKKGLYKRSPRHRWALKQHIFCNYHQNKLLDKLVTKKWRQPNYFEDSPYEPYYQRTNSDWHPTGKKFYP